MDLKDEIISQKTSFGGAMRNHSFRDEMVISRKVGHPELIFNDSPFNIQEFSTDNCEGKWTFSNHGCYVCQRHNYVQIFFKRERANMDWHKVTDASLIEILKITYKLD